MEEIKAKIGDLVTYSFAILYVGRVYRYLEDLPHGMALAEDNEGHRWRFSRKALVPATEEQKKIFEDSRLIGPR